MNKRSLFTLLISLLTLSGCVNPTPTPTPEPTPTPTPEESTTPEVSTTPEDSSTPEGSSTPEESIISGSYQIKITDIDGELLGSKTIELTNETSVWEDLKANFDVTYTNGDYGAYISSINNSIVDSNYYLAIYENNSAASTGVEGLVADNKDVFEFKVECWNTISSGYGTMDEYDVLVDKAIYGYMKQLDLSTSTTYADSTYWDLMTINLAKNNFYDSNVFNYDSISQAVKDEVNGVDVSTLTGANILKYFVYARALSLDVATLKTSVTSYLETLPDSYSAYVTPFIVSASYGLGIQHEKLTTLTNVEISTDLTWGPDASIWQFATSSLYNEELNADDLALYTTKLDYENCCSTAIVLQAFAALNENVRDSKYEVNEKDLIEVLFDNYYNETTNEIEYTKGVENTYSSNQVIASLMAYKVCRDTGKKANIYE